MGSTFTGWSGACAGTDSCVITMNAARSVTATFVLQQRTLSVVRAGAGSGSVSSAPAGISCGGDCSAVYDYGTVVVLTAHAATGSDFTGWSGACSGSSSTCTVTMTAARSVSANFVLRRYPVEVTRDGAGSGSVASSPAGIACGSDCSEEFDHGSSVTLTATANASSLFAGWTGACSGASATCTLDVVAARAVTATFTLRQFVLTVSRDGNGSGTVSSIPAGIDCGTDCTKVYDYGTSVTLTATPVAGSNFTSWSGACAGSSATCTVSMDAAKSVTATFTLQRHTLEIVRAGTGDGSVTSTPNGIACGSDCSEDYDHGTVVTLTADPATGSVFSGWSGACSGSGTSCTVSMTAARTATATFVLQQYALTVSHAGPGSGAVTSSPAGIACGGTCSATYDHGTAVTLTAAASTGSSFVGWSGACAGSASTCTVAMTAAKSVTATFVLQTFAVTVSRVGSGAAGGTVASTPAGVSCGSDCSETWSYGTSVTLTASTAAGTDFVRWSTGPCSGSTAATCTFVVSSTVSVEAEFATAGGDCTCAPGMNVITGTSGNDTLVGTSGRDCILGLAGDDHLMGRQERDILCGGPGADTLEGDQQGDELYGGDGDDLLLGGQHDDLLDGGAGSDHLGGDQGTDTLLGGLGNDWLDGDNGHDDLRGGPGCDALDGRNGPDDLRGEDGNDIINGAHAPDVCDGAAGNDWINCGATPPWQVIGGPGTDACTAADCELPAPASCAGSAVCPSGTTCDMRVRLCLPANVCD